MSEVVVTNTNEVVKAKPLSATQAKNLEKLVEGDMMELRDRLLEEVARRAREKKEEIDASYSKDTSASQAEAKLLKIMRDAQDKISALRAQYTAAGLEVAVQAIVPSATVKNHKAEDEKDKIDVALRVVNEKIRRLIESDLRNMRRNILVASITTAEVKQFTDQMPSVEDMLQKITDEMKDDEHTKKYLEVLK